MARSPRSRASSQEEESEEEDHEDDDDFAFEDMRETVFPSHKAHRLVMNPLMEWRLPWDIAMMVLIVFVDRSGRCGCEPFPLASWKLVPVKR